MTAAGNLRARRGVALMTSLYFLTILGMLVTGGLLVARGARRGGELAIADAMLTATTETALARALVRWDAAARSTHAIGATTRDSLDSGLGRTSGSVATTRLTNHVFQVVADVRHDGASEARRRVHRLVRLRHGAVPPHRALVALGSVTVGAGVRIEPDGPWRGTAYCRAPREPAPAIVVGPGSVVRHETIGDSVAWIADSLAADAATYDRFGDETWTALAERASLRLPHGAVAQLSSGAPAIVLAEGDLVIEGGGGAGILLVTGALRIRGRFAFDGVIVARGAVVVAGDDVALTGALLSAAQRGSGSETSSVVLRGTVTLRASSCTTERMFAAFGGVRAIRERAWLELF